MGNLSGFKPMDYEPSQGFEVLPAGDYDAVIVESQLKPTKKGDGQYLELKWQILTGTHKNRFLWSRLNIDNTSEKAQAIGRGQLSAICRAVNVLSVNDSSELHMKPLKIVVKVGDDGRGNPTNEIKGYKPRHANGGAPTAQPTAPAGQTTQLMTQPSAPPAMTGGAPRSPFA